MPIRYNTILMILVRRIYMGSNHVEIDQKAIDRLKRKIVIAENNNLKTKNKTEAQMIADIKKWIEEEVKCCLNR